MNKNRSAIDIYRPVVVYGSKTDIQSAFRLAPLKKESWCWLVMMAQNPMTGKWVYFVEKCLPFGASTSCSHFQRISNGLKHIVEVRHRTTITNYLDDFLFLALTIWRCNYLLQQFLLICKEIGFPIAYDKTDWASDMVTFLGLLLNGRLYTLSIPLNKKEKAEQLLSQMLSKNKTKIHDLQVLCGYLNFIGRAIHPGRVFTRRMYAKYAHIVNFKSNNNEFCVKKYMPKPYHHVKIDSEFRSDCKVWWSFITDNNLQTVINRPMVDFTEIRTAKQLAFTSDASAGERMGFGCIFNKKWIFGQWPENFIETQKPNIEYLELYAMCAGILTWQDEDSLKNVRIEILCDNQGVVGMVNKISSSCPNCMHLLRIMVLNGLIHNRRIFMRYINTKKNILPDALSRMDIAKFRKYGPQMNEFPDKIHEDIWPITKIWQNIKK